MEDRERSGYCEDVVLLLGLYGDWDEQQGEEERVVGIERGEMEIAGVQFLRDFWLAGSFRGLVL